MVNEILKIRSMFSLGQIVASNHVLKMIPREIILKAVNTHASNQSARAERFDDEQACLSSIFPFGDRNFVIRTYTEPEMTVISFEDEENEAANR